MVPVELVFNVLKELCDRDRPCNSKLDARKERKNNIYFVSGQILEIIIESDYIKLVTDYFNFSRTTTLQNSF